MSVKFRSVCAASLLGLASALPATLAMAQPAAAPPADMSAARQALFVEALDSMAKKDWATCRVRGLGVWTQKRHAQVAALLGLCEARLGLVVEAAEHIAYYREFDDKSSPGRTKDVEDAWSEIKDRVAIVAVSSPKTEVQLFRDGKLIGVAPQTLYVTSTGASIELRKEGYKNRVEQIEGVLGSTTTKTVDLEANAGSDTKPPEASIPQWPGWIFTGVAVAGIAVGSGLLGARAGSDEELDELAGLNLRCSETAPTGDCARLSDLVDERNGFVVGSIVGFSVAGAAAAGAVVFFVVGGEKKAKADNSAQVVPWLGPDAVGAQAHFSF